MKKVFAVALAMTVAVGMLAGCGSNDSAQARQTARLRLFPVRMAPAQEAHLSSCSALKKKTTQVKKSTTPQTQRKSQTAQPL